jgi:ATP-binding cassette subfamily C protein CydC
MRDLIPYLRLYRRHLLWVALGGGLGLITALAGVGLIALSSWFLSAAAFAGLTLASAQAFNFFQPGAMVRLLAILRTAGRYGERLTTHEATFRLLADLRVHAWRRLAPLSPAQLLRERSGELLGRLTSDIDALDNLYLRVLQPIGLALLGGGLLALGLSWLDPAIAALVLGGYLITGLLAGLLTLRGGRLAGAGQTHAIAALRTRLLAGWEGFNELQVYGGWQAHRAAIEQEEAGLIEAQHRERRLSGAAGALIAAGGGLTALAALWLAMGEWQAGRMAGPFLALIGLGTLAAFETLAPVVNAFAALGRSHSAAQRLNRVLHQTPAIPFPQQGPQPENSRLEISNLTLRHAPDAPAVLEGFNLSLAPGERLALSGPSGSGKSSLLAAIARDLLPAQGQIRLGGIPLEQLDQPGLRRHIALLAQHDHLFDDTLAVNLRLAAPQASDAELTRVLTALGLKQWLEALPEGLNSWLGHGGERLSGGQARRLTLGRLLLSPAPILLLDEPTEGLDPRSRKALWQAIEPWLENRSLIVASHQRDDWQSCGRRERLG